MYILTYLYILAEISAYYLQLKCTSHEANTFKTILATPQSFIPGVKSTSCHACVRK